MKKLVRPKDRLLFGVCGAIARQFNFDPTLVRLVFGIFTVTGLATPFMILSYVVAVLVIPDEK